MAVYRVMWRCGRNKNLFPEKYPSKAEAKRVATWKIKHMYLDDVTVIVEDNGIATPLEKRRRVFKDMKPYYSEWEYL